MYTLDENIFRITEVITISYNSIFLANKSIKSKFLKINFVKDYKRKNVSRYVAIL